jgi:hypothetical protein
MRRGFLAPLLLTLTGCAVPCLMSHTYSFTGVVLDDRSGAPVQGATVVLDAATAPYEGYDPRQGSAVTAKDGSYAIKIEEFFCHTAWIIPPLGTFGGSCMNRLSDARIRIRIDDQPRFDSRVPVVGRTEADEHPWRIDHSMTEVRLKDKKDAGFTDPPVPSTAGSGSSGRGRPGASTGASPPAEK